jgi:hypothetical protein
MTRLAFVRTSNQAGLFDDEPPMNPCLLFWLLSQSAVSSFVGAIIAIFIVTTMRQRGCSASIQSVQREACGLKRICLGTGSCEPVGWIP